MPSLAATDLEGRPKHVRQANSPHRTQVSIIDIKRAYFNAVIEDDKPVFVELPDEDPDKARGMCGQNLVHMYGTRQAGAGWHSDYSNYLTDDLGFTKALPRRASSGTLRGTWSPPCTGTTLPRPAPR